MKGPLTLLAEVLQYPGPDLVAVAEDCRRALAELSKEAAGEVEAFLGWAAGSDEAEREELYARSFDLHPPHCLDLGYQLFGESYKRGAFLVRVQAAVREHHVPQGPELGDHLTVVLQLLEALPEDEARALADEAALPVLDKVLGAFADRDNPYRHLLEAARALLMARFQISQVGPLPQEVHAPSPALFKLELPPRANRHDDPLPGGTAR